VVDDELAEVAEVVSVLAADVPGDGPLTLESVGADFLLCPACLVVGNLTASHEGHSIKSP